VAAGATPLSTAGTSQACASASAALTWTRFGVLSNPIAAVISAGDVTGTINNDGGSALPELIFAHSFE